MQLPKSVRFVVIGAGVHGLSTAYHLAKELKARGEGSGEDILIVDKTGIAAGASGHRLRRRAQQLLPAGNVRADGRQRRGLGVRPGRVPLQLGRLHGARAGGPGVRPERGRERQERIGYERTL